MAARRAGDRWLMANGSISRSSATMYRVYPGRRVGNTSLYMITCLEYVMPYKVSLRQYGAHIYSPLGPLLHSFTPSSHSFSPVSSTEDPGLGVRCATWAPGGRWLALGGWDGRVRVIESEGGRCIANVGWATKTAERDTVRVKAVILVTALTPGNLARTKRVAERYQG